jgi:predicted MFS family arabinose efflux permease
MEALIILAFCMTALSMPMRTYFPVFVKDIFHRGPETYGNLLALMGLGSICGSLGIASAGNIKKKGRVALGALICLGLGISGFALSKSLRVSEVVLVVVGASMMAVFATVNSLVQLITTNEMRGRVMSVYNFAFRGGMPMGNLGAGREWLFAGRAGFVFSADSAEDGWALSNRPQGYEPECNEPKWMALRSRPSATTTAASVNTTNAVNAMAFA